MLFTPTDTVNQHTAFATDSRFFTAHRTSFTPTAVNKYAVRHFFTPTTVNMTFATQRASETKSSTSNLEHGAAEPPHPEPVVVHVADVVERRRHQHLALLGSGGGGVGGEVARDGWIS